MDNAILPDLPRYRFRGDGIFQPALTALEVISHIKAGGKLYYKAPMDIDAKRIYCTGQLKHLC
jgi:hypothetical protein